MMNLARQRSGKRREEELAAQQDERTQTTNIGAISLTHMFGPLVLFGIGLISATLILILEKLIFTQVEESCVKA